MGLMLTYPKFNEKGAASGCIHIPVEGLDVSLRLNSALCCLADLSLLAEQEPIEGCYIMVDDTKADEAEAAAFQFLGSAILNRNERRWREHLETTSNSSV